MTRHSGYRRLSGFASALCLGNLRVPRRALRLLTMGKGNLSRPRLALGPTGDQVPFDVLISGATAGPVPIFKLLTPSETFEFLSSDREG